MNGEQEMDISGVHSEKLSELDQFKIALREEYGKKAEEMKILSEKTISEKLFASRREAEHGVQSLREEHKRRYSYLLEREKRLALLKVRGEALMKISELFEQVSRKIEAEIEKMHRDHMRYRLVLGELVREALDALGDGAVIKILPGEASLLPSDPRIKSVEEDKSGLAGGGCIVEDVNTRSIIVDNRIVTRWKQFKKIFILKFSENFGDVLQEFDRFSRELRIS